MAVQFKCPVQKLAFEISEDAFSSSEKYKKIVLAHYFNHSVRSWVGTVITHLLQLIYIANIVFTADLCWCYDLIFDCVCCVPYDTIRCGTLWPYSIWQIGIQIHGESGFGFTGK